MKTNIVSIRLLVVAFPLLLGSAASPAADPAPVLAKDWQFDVIQLKNGYSFKGLVLEQTEYGVRFQQVRRATGRPTVCIKTFFHKDDIEKLERLPDAEREVLKNRLKDLDETGEGERRRMESLELLPSEWNGRADKGLRYDSDYFSLVSNAPEDVVRRLAVRLEQIYVAYAQFLPPRFRGGKPTTIVLYSNLADYRDMLEKLGWQLQNPAFFNPEDNRIVCGSNLGQLGEDLKKARLAHKEGRAELDKQEAEYRKLFGKHPVELARRMQDIQEFRRQLTAADTKNEALFTNATKRLSTILYHEAFHAYVCNFVYPLKAGPGELPRWLNEGLAQIFETAIVEAGELRVGHADTPRLLKAKESVRKNEMMPLKDLLHSGANLFLVQHSDERLMSGRAYLASWALTAYLSFDRRLLGSARFDAYVKAVNSGGDPEAAFAALTGQKLPEFEKDFHAWLTKAPSEGSLIEPLATRKGP